MSNILGSPQQKNGTCLETACWMRDPLIFLLCISVPFPFQRECNEQAPRRLAKIVVLASQFFSCLGKQLWPTCQKCLRRTGIKCWHYIVLDLEPSGRDEFFGPPWVVGVGLFLAGKVLGLNSCVENFLELRSLEMTRTSSWSVLVIAGKLWYQWDGGISWPNSLHDIFGLGHFGAFADLK